MLDVGAVGSPVDVATLVVVVVQLGIVIRSRVDDLSAATVALARGRDDIDDERIQADLDVADRDVAQYVRERIVACGGVPVRD